MQWASLPHILFPTMHYAYVFLQFLLMAGGMHLYGYSYWIKSLSVDQQTLNKADHDLP